MAKTLITLLALAFATSIHAVPTSQHRRYSSPSQNYTSTADWLNANVPGKWPVPCTSENQEVRYDFDAMPPADRKAYTDAINCLWNQPSQLDQSVYPGAKNRYLDYAALHIERTLNVHLDGFFLVWHRTFIWLFEQDLKQTCGYQGTQPYWNWPATVDDLAGSNLFNGDEYSMSSNGYPQDLNSSIVLSPGLSIPHGTGGGCIMSGPFANWTREFNTIPIGDLLSGGPLPANAFDKNESCLTRDLNPIIAQATLNQTAIDNALAAADQETFQFLLNGSPIEQILGIHSGAHFTMGDPASNIFVSVQDPIWWPLHTMLDNLYIQWQNAHPDLALELYGTETAENTPASANVTLTTTTPDWGYFHDSLMVGELMNNTAGPFCYRYE